MTWKPSVLVVAPTPSFAATVFTWLTDAGCAPLIVSSFSEAKPHLEAGPAVLISEIRLGEYNGLHLALRAQVADVPAVLIGDPDSVLQREAAQLNATYLTYEVDSHDLLSVVWQCAAAPAEPAEPRWRAGTTGVSFVALPVRARASRAANPVGS